MNRRFDKPMSTRFFLAGLLVIAIAMPVSAASLRELEQTVNAMDGRLVRLEKLLNNQVLLEIVQRLQVMQKEVQLLRGDSELSLHEINLLKKRQRELYLDIDQRLQQLEGVAQGTKDTIASVTEESAIERAPSQAEPVQTSKSALPEAIGSATPRLPPGVTPTVSEQSAYNRAFNLLKERRYEGAVKAFSTFLAAYPQSLYAGNAQYWLAEANYVSRKFPVAKVEFKKVIDNFPTSPKVPDATLKLGFTHYELAEWDEARKVLAGLGKQYPNSTVARLANERLKRMKQEGH